jgi:hypothetical protein
MPAQHPLLMVLLQATATAASIADTIGHSTAAAPVADAEHNCIFSMLALFTLTIAAATSMLRGSALSPMLK